MYSLLLREHLREFVILSREEFGREHVWFSQNVFEKEAEALSSHATLVAAQVERRLQVIDVEDDFIVTDRQGVKVVEVREEKPDFGSVVSNGSIGISTRAEGGRKFEEQMLSFRIKRRSFQIVFLIIIVKFRIDGKIPPMLMHKRCSAYPGTTQSTDKFELIKI